MPGMKIRNCFNNSFDIFRWRHCLTVPLFLGRKGACRGSCSIQVAAENLWRFYAYFAV